MTSVPPDFTVAILDWGAARAHARPVRETVFVHEQRVPIALEWDEWDERCDHAVAFDCEGRGIGTGRLLPDGRIGRMAVLREWRRRGVGSAILEALIERAKARCLKHILLHAQTGAVDFYRHHGFETEGAEFEEAGIPHFTMARAIA